LNKRGAGFPACQLERLSSRSHKDLRGLQYHAELESSANWQPGKAAPHKIYGMAQSPVDKGSSHLISGFHARGALPHLKQEGACYFVTFRLTGTLPKEVLRQLKAEWQSLVPRSPQSLTWRQQTGLFEWYSSHVDKYLDAGHGQCWLRRPEIAEIVATALQFHAGVRFENHAWCVMQITFMRSYALWETGRLAESSKAGRGTQRTKPIGCLVEPAVRFGRSSHLTIAFAIRMIGDAAANTQS